MSTILFASLLQLCAVLFFGVMERLFPRVDYKKDSLWWQIWGALLVYSSIWLQIVMIFWLDVKVAPLFHYEFEGVWGIILFYLFYSHGNYWFHRFKHTNAWFWKHVHGLHHAPQHMEVAVAFFRHPIEISFNTLYLLFIGKVIFDVPIEIIFCALVIEGCLESFHHANIAWPNRLDWVGRFVQIPPMHLVHHECGRHTNNYSPLFWDYLYGTCEIPGKRVIPAIGLNGDLSSRLWNFDLTISKMLCKLRSNGN
ncbi:MAG: sterol desaturase family protein [Arenicella sp.]